MYYPLVEAFNKANNNLDADLAALGYRLSEKHQFRSPDYGPTGITYDFEGIGEIGISALDPDSDLFAVLATYEHVLDSFADVYRKPKTRDVITGKKPNPYPPDWVFKEQWNAELGCNPHHHGPFYLEGRWCSLNFV